MSRSVPSLTGEDREGRRLSRAYLRIPSVHGAGARAGELRAQAALDLMLKRNFDTRAHTFFFLTRVCVKKLSHSRARGVWSRIR